MSNYDNIRLVRGQIALVATPLFKKWEFEAKLNDDEAIVLWFTEFDRISQLEICKILNISGMYPERRIRRIYSKAVEKVRKYNDKGGRP